MILADENIDRLIIESLRDKGFSVYSIKEKTPSISDEEIVRISKSPPQVILTNDKDFGNWVFAHNVKDISVVFLRYQFYDRFRIAEIVVKLFQDHQKLLLGKFTTVTVKKIRTSTLR